MELAIQFEKELERQTALAKKECRYPATRFRQMLRQYGGVGTAKRLLQDGMSGKISEGFATLAYIEGRPDLTMEYTVCMEKYQPLFSAEEISYCKHLLNMQ